MTPTSGVLSIRSSRLQMFFKIGVLKNFANFTGKHLCWSLFLIKLQGWRPSTLSKRDSNKRFPVEFPKCLFPMCDTYIDPVDEKYGVSSNFCMKWGNWCKLCFSRVFLFSYFNSKQYIFSKIYVFIKNLKEIMSAYNAMFFKFLKVEIHDKIHLRFT